MDNEETYSSVISRIRQIRLSKGLSQMEVCLRANLSQSFFANLEAGKKQASVMTIIRIAAAMNVNPKDFFPENSNKSSDEIKSEIKELLELL